MKIEILRLDEPNKNGHVYPKEVIEESLKKVYGKKLVGTIKPADEMFLSVLAAFAVENTRIEDSMLVGDMTILPTLHGREMELFNFDLGYVSCGYGDIDEQGVVSNFELISIAAVPIGDKA